MSPPPFFFLFEDSLQLPSPHMKRKERGEEGGPFPPFSLFSLFKNFFLILSSCAGRAWFPFPSPPVARRSTPSPLFPLRIFPPPVFWGLVGRKGRYGLPLFSLFIDLFLTFFLFSLLRLWQRKWYSDPPFFFFFPPTLSLLLLRRVIKTALPLHGLHPPPLKVIRR